MKKKKKKQKTIVLKESDVKKMKKEISEFEYGVSRSLSI